MQRNFPKLHHFNPKMLLKNFSNGKEQVWVNDGAHTYRTHIRNVSAIHYLNAKWDWSAIPKGTDYEKILASVPRTDEYEIRLGDIESAAEPVIAQIIEQTRHQKCLNLTSRQRDILKRFVFTSARRTPESQIRAGMFSAVDDAFYDTAKQVADLNNFPLPDKETLYADLGVCQLRDMVLSNTRARFAAGDHSDLEAQELKFAQETGLVVAVIRDQCEYLVLGSHGITLLDPVWLQYLPAISWLPAAPDIAIGVTAFPDRDFMMELSAYNGGAEIVSLMNRSTAVLSERIIGASEDLVRSLK